MDTAVYWVSEGETPAFETNRIAEAIDNFRNPVHIIFDAHNRRVGLAQHGNFINSAEYSDYMLLGSLPPLYPEWLGDRAFLETHRLRFAYVGGAMARGIASTEMVIKLGMIGCLGFFGSAGLPVKAVEEAIITIKQALDSDNRSWGMNLIHTPGNPELEETLIELYLQHGVHRVCAAAFMGLGKSLVRYASKGLHRDRQGHIKRKHYLFAKISHPDVAQHFMQPPPLALLNELLAEGGITAEEAELARQIPVAEDITIESDSGGHTDGRPLNALYSTICELRDELQAQYRFTTPVRLGCAGSLGTPASVAAAYGLGAAYVLLGSVHQSSVESGLSLQGKQMLCQAGLTDTIMTPSADMFELGGRVQVLKKGSLMGMRGNQLWELYQRYASLDEIPQQERTTLEKHLFRQSLHAIWQQTQAYFEAIDPREIERAVQSEKYKMALVFRWYLGNSSKWALQGDADRIMDYQIWCGPAMGAFNRWVRGSFLEKLENRTVQQMALNLLEGAAHSTRAHQLRSYGIHIPPECNTFRPRIIQVEHG